VSDLGAADVIGLMGRRRWHAPAILALAAAALNVTCFSERRDGTGPDVSAQCQIPIDSSVVGSTRTLVAIRDFAFVPATIRVPPGSTVTWVNCEPPDRAVHTSTSDIGAWDSGPLPSGAVFSHTFDQAGEFPYHCVPHPFMRATVVVE
jgi:plastocyanin